MFWNSRRTGRKELKHRVDSLASISVTFGVIAASISLLVYEGLQIRFAHNHLAELDPRSEGLFTYVLVLFGTTMLFLYVGLLAVALFVQVQRVITMLPI